MPLRSDRPVDRIIIHLAKHLARMGINDLYRAFGERVIEKDKDGWNRPVLGEIYHKALDGIEHSGYDGCQGTILLKKALASVLVVMDDDDVYFILGLNMFGSVKDIVLPDDWRTHKGKGFVERDMDKDVVT